MKNPKEYYWKNGKKTFCVMNELTQPECIDGSEPLSFHHETFSRFHFVIINEDRRAVVANIPVSEMPGIFKAINNQAIISQVSKRLQAATASSGEERTAVRDSSAYTVFITAGKLKGKTPAGALLENAEVNKSLLINQVTWLESNLQKYPKNEEQIRAIKEALQLYEAGKLTRDSAAAAIPSKVDIYPGGLRPLVRRKKQNGKSFVYHISISMYENGEKPIEIKINNFFAPVIVTDAGLYNVQAKEKEDDLTVTFNISLSEWAWFEHQTEAQMRTFENILAPNMYKKAFAANTENRLKAKL